MKDRKEIESLKARQAELAREQEKLAERIERMEKPETKNENAARRLYFGMGGKLFDSEESFEKQAIKILESVYGKEGQKTRYNWPEIIKKYPEAQWASTDADGRIDAWDRKPKGGYGDEDGRWVGCGCKSNGDGGHKHVGHTKDWTDSLEKRPDNL